MIGLNLIAQLKSNSIAVAASIMCFFSTFNFLAQQKNNVDQLEVWSTRSWVRLDWPVDAINKEYKIYWATSDEKPDKPGKTIKSNKGRYYIKGVQPKKDYWVWVEFIDGDSKNKELKTQTRTKIDWALQKEELEELKVNPSSKAVPEGMMLVWQDEFMDSLLNRNKWSTNYYSSIDALRGDNEKDMLSDQLPQPAYVLNGESIDLYVSDTLPTGVYDEKNDKKISSIQTYDWRKDENLLDNSRGGYFEVRVKRKSTGTPKGLNTAFWFDAPGPDLRNYLQEGIERDGVEGVRPRGQVFEIDVFEYINAQFVLHGNVDEQGEFVDNLDTHIAEGYEHFDKWVTHGVLWSPTTIKHYINGELIKEYNDKHKMHSPNHFMSVLLGSYGSGGTVNMKVDYIRFYQWLLENNNELPNPGFDDNKTFEPWVGDAVLKPDEGIDNSQAVMLKPGVTIEQYVYLENNQDYELDFSAKGNSTVDVKVDNVKLVKGSFKTAAKDRFSSNENYQQYKLNFYAGKEYGDYKKKVRVSLKNEGDKNLYIDNVFVKQN